MGDDQVELAKDAGKDPEHDQSKTDHADHAIEQLSIQPKLALEGDRDGKEHDERDPDRSELDDDTPDDIECAERFHILCPPFRIF